MFVNKRLHRQLVQQRLRFLQIARVEHLSEPGRRPARAGRDTGVSRELMALTGRELRRVQNRVLYCCWLKAVNNV